MIMMCWKLGMNEIKSHALVSEVQVNISFKCKDDVNDEIYIRWMIFVKTVL